MTSKRELEALVKRLTEGLNEANRMTANAVARNGQLGRSNELYAKELAELAPVINANELNAAMIDLNKSDEAVAWTEGDRMERDRLYGQIYHGRELAKKSFDKALDKLWESIRPKQTGEPQ